SPVLKKKWQGRPAGRPSPFQGGCGGSDGRRPPPHHYPRRLTPTTTPLENGARPCPVRPGPRYAGGRQHTSGKGRWLERGRHTEPARGGRPLRAPDSALEPGGGSL